MREGYNATSIIESQISEYKSEIERHRLDGNTGWIPILEERIEQMEGERLLALMEPWKVICFECGSFYKFEWNECKCIWMEHRDF